MLKSENRDGVLVLCLDNPRRLNAWSEAVREEFRRTLKHAEQDPATVAVVITGSGERAFCAGADLTDPKMGDPAAAQGRMVAFRALFVGIQSFRKPLVAALNGLTLGSAFQAVMLMDWRIAHAGVRLGLPEMNSGIPCITGTAILAWTVGPQLARSIALSGRFIEASEAHRLGLVEEVVENDRVLDRAIEVARELASKSSEAFAETKHWTRDLYLPALDAAFARAAATRAKESVAHAVQSGISGFFGRDKTSGQ